MQQQALRLLSSVQNTYTCSTHLTEPNEGHVTCPSWPTC